MTEIKSNSENIIEVKDLVKIYKQGNVKAVDKISFNVKKGEILALLGPNGAGKTTIISVLATLLFLTEGKAIVNGYDVTKFPDKVRKSIGVVFQEPSLDGELTGRENLEFHTILYSMDKKIRTERIDEVLELVDLKDKQKTYTKNYSGGMKRRLEIARGLFMQVIMAINPVFYGVEAIRFILTGVANIPIYVSLLVISVFSAILIYFGGRSFTKIEAS